MDIKSLLIGGLAGLLLAGIPAGFIYSNVNRNLSDAEDEIAELQGEVATGKEDITKVRQELKEKEEDLNKRISEITGLQRDVETVGNCLTGVLEAFQEISQDNGPDALIILGRVEKDCEKSGEILEEIENLETSLDEVTQDSLELINVYDLNIKNPYRVDG
ncbi:MULTISPECIES: hypothetical protein [Crocosphaera]|uniref:hypothetical protein n=1 Tax=Crocosphaera TaxID=263510 RepID=UPI00257CCB66|nr:hypothetical protein [Crocosphaera sp.]MCH2246241.1 hypothetical protein [Crocosphaera sp.]NQZ61736.1 hypothetical protein [Crocosphaera sp.]